MSYGVSWQNLNINPYKISHLQSTPPLSFFRVDYLNDIFLFIDSTFSMHVHSWFYLFSIVFFYISMPLLESMLLSLLPTQVEIGPSNASPGSLERKNATEQIKNMTLARIWTQVLRYIAPTLYQLSYVDSWQNLKLIFLCFHIFKSLRHYLSYGWTFWMTYFFLLTVFIILMSTVNSIYLA